MEELKMKTQITIKSEKSIYRKNIFVLLFITIIFTFLSISVFAQSPFKNQHFMTKNEKQETHITDFSLIQAGGKNYLSWTVKGEDQSSIYVVERSFDGATFESVCIKNGYVAPEQMQLMYCYTDENATTLGVSYRIKQIFDDGLVYISDIKSANPTTDFTQYGLLK